MRTQVNSKGQARCCRCNRVRPIFSSYAGPDDDGEVCDPLCRACATGIDEFETAEAIRRRTHKAPNDPIAADLIDGLRDAVLAELRQCNDPNALVCALAALRKS